MGRAEGLNTGDLRSERTSNTTKKTDYRKSSNHSKTRGFGRESVCEFCVSALYHLSRTNRRLQSDPIRYSSVKKKARSQNLYADAKLRLLTSSTSILWFRFGGHT